MKKYIKLVIGIAFTALFLFLSYKSVGELDFRKVFTYPLNYLLIPLSALFFVLAHWFRSLAWSRGLNKRLRTAGVFRAVCMGTATNMVMPFRMGEAVRVAALGQAYKDIDQEKDKALYYKAGTNSVAERLVDGTIFVFLAAAMVFFVDFEAEVTRKIYWLRNLILAGIPAGILAFGIFRHLWLNHKLRFKWVEKVFSVAEEMALVNSPGVIVSVIGYLLTAWLCVYICIVIGLLSVGVASAKVLPIALTVLIMTNLAVLLPAVPGGIGVFEYACIYSLGLFGISGIQAAVSAILLHLIQYMALLPLGLYFCITSKIWRSMPKG